ncbi:MAG: PD-(D/E)XK nuclease family protein [Prevotella sp.]|nr:PD-(D/E)XK nuclease family protein [Prevotella sp.]
MKDFLYYVAEDILSKHGTNLSDVAVVFPNKRASLFLNDHLAHLAAKPIWSPAYITISELFRQQSALSVADPIRLVCELHKSFCAQTGSQETLDRFFGWGQLLVSDFDDVDKNMADADRVFANLRDIHELDDVSYLTDEQSEAIRRFFSNFSDEYNSQLKERFLSLWSHFAAIYHDFNQRLAEQGLAYEGALYRQVAEQLPSASFPHKCYIFVGFNLVQKAEQRLFSHLLREGKARFYWDFDSYYLQSGEAGQYIAQYLPAFPNELDSTRTDIYDNFRLHKQIRYIAAPTENIQARYVSTWLREQSRYRDARRTAIVMCNEQLLPTVIHCLPPEAGQVNVTTGYPLSQTPVAALLSQLLALQTSQYPPRYLRRVRRHPYARYISDEALTTRLPQLTPEPLLQWLISCIRQTATGIRPTDNSQQPTTNDALAQESLFRAYTLLNRLKGLAAEGQLSVDVNTLCRLVTQLVAQTSIPFHGEPAEGIQVMGILETRNLDFDHVLLLSTGEGNMPRGLTDSSFIPHSLRRAYELTTIENKAAIYSYYFHRLIQRASDVTMLYNSSTEDGQRGEMSRFMLQLMVESPHHVSMHTLQSGHAQPAYTPSPIAKTVQVMHTLQGIYAPQGAPGVMLSPTAINCFMRCSLQFYYRYVAGIREPDVPDDEQELDSRLFGNIFHQSADIIYHQLPRHVDRSLLQHLLKTRTTIERAVDEAFHRELPQAPAGGLHIINREVIIQYLLQLLQIDMRLAPFTILGLEHDVSQQLILPSDDGQATGRQQQISIGGRIDRLDQLSDGTIRVVDYKTGSGRLKPLPDVDAIFSPDYVHQHADYYLQTFVYADIVSRQQQATAAAPVAPALLFIQHAGGEDYDPTLCFGRTPIRDVAPHSARFRELLLHTIGQMFSPDVPFEPTADMRTCQSCPYLMMCRAGR